MDKQARYIPDLLQSAISVASENSINTFTTPYDSPQLILLTSDDPNHHHAMKKYETYHVSMERGYWSRKCDEIICYKKLGSIAPHALIKTRNFITVVVFQYWFRDQDCLHRTSTLYSHLFSVESAEIKRFFYTKNTLSRVVIFSFSKFWSTSWKQFFFLVDLEN